VLELLDSLERAAGVTAERRFEPLRKGELRASALDAARIRDELGWEPTVGLDDGLAQTFAWYRVSDSAA
jgi:nucleoside-diphosphate-sugar epimerase